jgi:hypothetical protein
MSYAIKTYKKITKLLKYEPYNKSSWKEFDEEDYLRIIKSITTERLKEKYGY